jgi:hypothetical protein
LDATARALPRRFTSCESSADDFDWSGHFAFPIQKKWISLKTAYRGFALMNAD